MTHRRPGFPPNAFFTAFSILVFSSPCRSVAVTISISPVEAANAAFKAAAEGELAGILGYEERPLVSADYVNDTRSSIVDASSTMVVNGTQVKIYAWYDNEMGYAHRLVDVAMMVGASL